MQNFNNNVTLCLYYWCEEFLGGLNITGLRYNE